MSYNSPRTLVKVPTLIRDGATIYQINEATPEFPNGRVGEVTNFPTINAAKRFIRSKVDLAKCKPGTVRTIQNMVLYGDKLPKGL